MSFNKWRKYCFVALMLSFNYSVYGQTGPQFPCNAYFEYTIECPSVGFISLSSGAKENGPGPMPPPPPLGTDPSIESEYWDFGDGTTEFNSPGSLIQHEYTSNGTFVVCLTISDTLGCSDGYCDTIAINCFPSCQASFQIDDSTCPEISFLNTSSFDPGDQIDSVFWDFGNSNSSDFNSQFEFPENNSYEICLFIQTVNGCNDLLCDTIEIGCYPECEANFEFNDDQCPEISFFSTSLTDQGDEIVEYSWDFNDGVVSNNSFPVHIYQENDNYEVCLTIDTQNGCSDVWCDSLLVDCILVECNSLFEIDTTNCPELSFFDLSTIESNDQIWSYNWNFGDGGISGSSNPTHTYNINGTYSVCLSIETMLDCDSEFCTEIEVSCLTVDIDEIFNLPKKPIQILDVMGRETSFKTNTPLIYLYDDGSTEKVFSVEY